MGRVKEAQVRSACGARLAGVRGILAFGMPFEIACNKTVRTVCLIMSEAHHRKKQPEAVRQILLDVAARLGVDKGAASVTLDAVSREAGVSKGGLLHHFPSKSDLLDGLLDDLVDRLEAAIREEMLADPEPHGRFTRAYLKVC